MQSLNIKNLTNYNYMRQRFLRIHGDNIVECERSLHLLSQALGVTSESCSTSLYKPMYELLIADTSIKVELLSGHDRWGIEITSQLMKNGGILREGADSYFTEVVDGTETILLAIEYCSALPAGNNAWQRNGRAYSSVLAGIPYLYYAEIGGVELDKDRNVKTPRFPNPIVPYSYLSTSKRMNKFCIPVYQAHPSITQGLYNHFKDIFGCNESLAIIRGIILKEDYYKPLNSLIKKDLQMVELLSIARRSKDTLRGHAWEELLNSDDSAMCLQKSELKWQKKPAGGKVATSKSFLKLHAATMKLNCRTIGAKDIPICLIPIDKIDRFCSLLSATYPNMTIDIDKTKPLAVVWITGFKPSGDDSRPDRGLTPLARMILGNSANILSIVYGPAKSYTWNKLIKSRSEIADDNGLWQSIINICDYLLVDSATCSTTLFYKIDRNYEENPHSVQFDYKSVDPIFSEHDTDSAIHNIFSKKEELGILESLCNPPGGDWSGISYFSENNIEYRWTSLPRVSVGAKRPDHLIQVNGQSSNLLIIIESKQAGKDLEDNIGNGLKIYINDLFSTLPTAIKKNGEWRLFTDESCNIKPFNTISVGAFIYKDVNDMRLQLRKNLDAIFAFEFGTNTVLHVLVPSENMVILEVLEKIKTIMPYLIISVH